jgi:hypothetical protein
MVLLALAGLSEAILRFAFGLGNPVLNVPDATCAYILKPDQNVFRFFAHTRTNRYGMRSDEVSSSRSPDTLRVLFVGDSITYGTSRVDQSDLFTERLHKDLPAVLHRPVEVLNASAGAWAIDNELSYIRSRGIFQSDLVVMVLNDGDVAQPRSTIADVGDDLPSERPATAIGELYSRYLRPRIFHNARHIDAGDTVAADSATIGMNLADLDAVQTLVTGQGARMVLVFAPFRGDVPVKSAKPRTILQGWAAAHHVAMFDMTPAELGYSSKEITLDNVHFNAKGHGVVAQEIERLWPEVVGNSYAK